MELARMELEPNFDGDVDINPIVEVFFVTNLFFEWQDICSRISIWENRSHPFTLPHLRLRINRTPASAYSPLLHFSNLLRDLLGHSSETPSPAISSLYLIPRIPYYNFTFEFEFFLGPPFASSLPYFLHPNILAHRKLFFTLMDFLRG